MIDREELNADTLRGLATELRDHFAGAPSYPGEKSFTRSLLERGADALIALLDENTSLRAELLEQAKANGAGAEREAKLMAERDAALRECAKWALEAGEAKGILEASELPGVVDGWREKCERIEAENAKLRNDYLHIKDEALEQASRRDLLAAENAALTAKVERLEDRLEAASSSELSDVEAEDALKSEGIYVWGPDGERFDRMFTVVMKARAALNEEG